MREGVDRLLVRLLGVVTLADPVERVVGEVRGRVARGVLLEPLDREVEVAAQVVLVGRVVELGRLDRARLETCAKTRRDNEGNPELIAEWAAALSPAPAEARLH